MDKQNEYTNESVMFNYFSGNIKFTKALGITTLKEFINAHRHPKKQTLDIMIEVHKAVRDGDLALKRQLKHRLNTFVPTALFKLGGARKYSEIIKFTGLMQLDFDGIESLDKAHKLKEYLFTTYQCVVCVYFSPSGKGVKALIRITTPRDKEHFKAIYKTVEAEFEQLGYFDTAVKNIVLPLFLSVDANILSRDFSQAIAWDKEDWTEPKRNTSTPTNLTFPTQRYANREQYYHDKTVGLFAKKINAIQDNGHPQVRSACLVLGSRVGAGYITQGEAQNLIDYYIENNGYLSKNTEGYIKTGAWCLEQGMSNPKEY